MQSLIWTSCFFRTELAISFLELTVSLDCSTAVAQPWFTRRARVASTSRFTDDIGVIIFLVTFLAKIHLYNLWIYFHTAETNSKAELVELSFIQTLCLCCALASQKYDFWTWNNSAPDTQTYVAISWREVFLRTCCCLYFWVYLPWIPGLCLRTHYLGHLVTPQTEGVVFWKSRKSITKTFQLSCPKAICCLLILFLFLLTLFCFCCFVLFCFCLFGFFQFLLLYTAARIRIRIRSH